MSTVIGIAAAVIFAIAVVGNAILNKLDEILGELRVMNHLKKR